MGEALFAQCLRDKYVYDGSPLFVAPSVYDALHAPDVYRIIKKALRRDPCIERESIMAFLESIVEDFILDEDQRVSCVKRGPVVGHVSGDLGTYRPRELCRDNIHSVERRASHIYREVSRFFR